MWIYLHDILEIQVKSVMMLQIYGEIQIQRESKRQSQETDKIRGPVPLICTRYNFKSDSTLLLNLRLAVKMD